MLKKDMPFLIWLLRQEISSHKIFLQIQMILSFTGLTYTQ